jgi:hypothetical protein
MSEPDLRYPLHYPTGWKRTKFRQSSNFDRERSRTFAQARDELLRQLNLLGATQVILSTNIPLRQDGLPYSNRKQPDDPGVAVYFQLNKKPMVLACDTWDRVIDNVWAIAKHIDAMRGQQRWGVGTLEQAFMGYQALPDAERVKPWWEVLGVSQSAKWDEAKAAFRDAAKKHHPDVGGERQQWDRIQQAYDQAFRDLSEREGERNEV